MLRAYQRCGHKVWYRWDRIALGEFTEHERSVTQRQKLATDREIGQRVYGLYGLTDEGVRIVEEATA